MPENPTATSDDSLPRRSVWPRRVLLCLLAVLVIASIALAFEVRHRIEQRSLGIGAIDAPEAPRALGGSSGKTGSFTAHIEFTSMAATEGQDVSTDVAWDDEWFFQDPTAYNHELATTCSVLSAVANAESAYYQAGSGSPAYMENALAALGFEEISTASYRYRSEMIDEIVDLFMGSDDVTAYSVATKRVTSEDGRTKTLYLVSIRGSYGAEWLSDLNMGDAADYDLAVIDHEGFMKAADEIVDDLLDRVTDDRSEGRTDDVAVLFCGHSRGAAAANLAAAYADAMTLGTQQLTELDSIYCYTFATPEVTQLDVVDDPMFDNIFNIMNPSDLVPRLPLASWGYARYGHDLWLPGYDDETFDKNYEQMCATFEENVGAECPYEPQDRQKVDKLVEDLGRAIPTADDLSSVGGVASLLGDLVRDINPMRVLYGHYPSVYIAWMQVIDADDLAPEQ